MARREDISNGIWSDPDFEALSLHATVLYLWSWTNPRCGMAGIYKVSQRAMTESKVPAEHIDAALAELAIAGFLFYEQNVCFVRTRLKHLRQKTKQIATSVANDLRAIGEDHPLRTKFHEEYPDSPWLRAAFSTLKSEAQASVAGGSSETPMESHSKTPSVETHLSLNGKGNGKGTGQGQGFKGKKETRDWLAWADANMPQYPRALVAGAAGMVELSKRAVTPEAVKARLLAAYPNLAAT